jgi:hypothetical protein
LTLSVFLNAFPLIFPDVELKARVIPYDKEQLAALREKHRGSHIPRRQGDEMLVFSADGTYPVAGQEASFLLRYDLGISCFLVKNALSAHLAKMGRQPIGFNPIELISAKAEDNVIAHVFGPDYPFKICAKYTIDTRNIRDRSCLIIDCATKKVVTKNCEYFLTKNFDFVGLAVTTIEEDGFRKNVGVVSKIAGNTLTVTLPDGTSQDREARNLFLASSRENFDAYILHTHGDKKDSAVEQVRTAVSAFNVGDNKKLRIHALKKYFQDRDISLLDGSVVKVGDSEDIQGDCVQIQKPVFVFNDRGEADWVEAGLTKFGPYTKRTFDRNNPSICVICSQHDKGRVEQFVRKCLKGISVSKYFANGLEGKFSIGTSRVEVITTATDDVAGYKKAIETAIHKKTEAGERWDLALVQVRQSFKKLNVLDNPYYWGKSLFFLHQVPVQDFTIELLNQSDYSLGYSLNNMALACYAKMQGVPWLLKSSPTLSHELVVGIGSANIEGGRFQGTQRIMGITTVFSGDGSYIVSNTSKAVNPEQYCAALTSMLGETIEKIQTRMNWQKGDTIRLIFHASVKKFSNDEIAAVRALVDKYREYQIEYAFLKISEDHGLHMFDSANEMAKKGKWAPQKGRSFSLSKYEMLLYLIGQRELRTDTDGHPRGLIVSVHKDSTFKDIKYLSAQLYSFASHSWRSYFPNPMPVTISYSDLIAKNLGWLNQLPGWNDSVMIGKIGQSQWFL